MWEFDTEVSEVIQRTPSVKSFRFPIRAKGVRYRSGQFFYITINTGNGTLEHHFSFSSSPTEKGHIEFTKRITSSKFSQTLAKMQPGARVHVKGPEGDFTLSRKFSQLAFLSGGIGITPLRSMLRYVVDKKLPYDIVMLYGNSSVEEIAFREELKAVSAAHNGVSVEHVLSGPNIPEGWKGKTGLINKDLVAELAPDYMKRLFYISGPPRMVLALEEQVVQLGVPETQIKKDKFIGYE
ncbi:MAG: oxidoreductase [Chloroflexi bacterium]|nr:oxidoreductase [Chloroflexota bacterium]